MKESFYQVGIFDKVSDTCIGWINVRTDTLASINVIRHVFDTHFKNYLDFIDIMIYKYNENVHDRILVERAETMERGVRILYNIICKFYSLKHTQIPVNVRVDIPELSIEQMLKTPGVYAEIDVRTGNIATYRCVSGGDEPIILDMNNGLSEDANYWLSIDPDISKNYTYVRVYKLPL